MTFYFPPYSIHDWRTSKEAYHHPSSCRFIYNNGWFCGSIYLHNEYENNYHSEYFRNNKWKMQFNISIFHELYKEMYGDEVLLFETLIEGQQHVDKFLNRLINLKVFL